MKRFVAVFSESDLCCLRSALRTAMAEDCGGRVLRRQEEVLTKVANARAVSEVEFKHLDYAISMAFNDEEDAFPNKRQREMARGLWHWLAKKLDPRGLTATRG